MAKFHGKVGYAGEKIESAPGVWVDSIVEESYSGDVIRNNRMLTPGEHLADDIRVNNQISIIADAYANEHFFAIRYVEWAGVLWTVQTVEVQRPRLILYLGEEYNGPTAG